MKVRKWNRVNKGKVRESVNGESQIVMERVKVRMESAEVNESTYGVWLSSKIRATPEK